MTESITLERAITNFKTNRTERNARRLIALLQENTYYLLLPSALMDPDQADRRAETEERIRQADWKNVPVLLFDTETEAGRILPVFTTRREMSRWPHVSGCAAVEVPFPAVCLLVSGHPEMDNLLINPEGNALAFGRSEFLQRFSAPFEADRTPQPSLQVLESRTAQERADSAALAALRQKAAQDPAVAALWLVLQRLEDESQRWLLVADTAAPERLEELARAFLQAYGSGTAGICLKGDPGTLTICEDFDPIYQRNPG